MPIITVKTNNPYEIKIGRNKLQEIGTDVKNMFTNSKVAIITDDIVKGLYSKTVIKSLKSQGIQVCTFAFDNGENSKTHDTVLKIYDFLCDNSITRSDIIIALGGGVVGDVAGYVAATYLRGIKFIQVPTTFLAAIDSSVGGKTGVNIAKGKNLIGAFWQPSLVVCDIDTFSTLSNDIFADGIAEAIKYGCIWDEDLFNDILNNNIKDNIESIVTKCVKIKKEVVQNDEFDKGQRMILNFGHTIGHAIEKQTNHKITHGHGVAIGMVLISKLGEKLGITNKQTTTLIKSSCQKYNLPISYNENMKDIANTCLNDKKRMGNTINVILCENIGKVQIKKINIEDFKEYITTL